MTQVSVARLTDLVAAAIRSTGAGEVVAAQVAEGLVGSDVAGVHTHGVAQLPRYIEAVRAGELDPVAAPTVSVVMPGAARVSGGWGFGHPAADLATRQAVAIAQEHGCSVVALVESHHIGRMGQFVETAAAEGIILQIFGGGQGVEAPAAVPYGGRSPVLHTNPIAIGAPAEPDRPLVVDIATTVTSGLKVREAAKQGISVPPGAIVDRDGSPTTDPGEFLEGGAHLPFGGHKGYGLMVVAEVLGRIVTGAEAYADTHLAGPVLRHSGYLFIGVRAAAFVDEAAYLAQVDALFDRIRSSPPAPGFSSVLVPGDPEARSRAQAMAAGIKVDDELLVEITTAAVSGGWVEDGLA